MEDDDFEIFASDQEGRPSNIDEVMALIRHHVNEHDMTTQEALGIIIDLVRPGTGENSHDVRPLFVGAMWAHGKGYLCDQFEGIFITTMPWGIGFSIATKQGFKFDQLFKDEQNTITESLCNVLQAGGLEARLDGDNKIILTAPDGEESTMDMDDIVAQFRVELDEELGPDAGKPDPDDPMGRWMP